MKIVRKNEEKDLMKRVEARYCASRNYWHTDYVAFWINTTISGMYADELEDDTFTGPAM